MSWSFVQSKGTQNTAAGNATVVLGSSVTVGDLVIVACCIGSQVVSTLPTVTDSTGNNTWHNCTLQLNSGGAGCVAVIFWTVIQASGGGSSWTVTVQANSSGAIVSALVAEFTPPAGTVSFDAESGTTATGNPITIASITPAGSDLFVGAFADQSSTSKTYTAQTGYSVGTSNLFQDGSAAGTPAGLEYLLNQSSGSSPSWTTSAGAAWAAVGAAFTAGSSPPPATSGGACLMAAM